MNFWLMILLVALAGTALIVALSAASSVVVLFFGKRYRKRMEDTAAGEVARHLPGSDCGQCSCGTCLDYARQTAVQGCVPGDCPSLSQEARDAIANYFEKREADFRARREAVAEADAAAGIRKKK